MNDLWRPLKPLAVHPLADIFPMLGEDELVELAADIKSNGLLHPIVRTVDGKTIVDGRNRYEACRRAGVEPTYDDRIRDDAEARALILSANVKRRHLTAGQRAMATAMIYPEPMEPEKSGALKGKVFRDGTPDNGVSKARLSIARKVLRYDAHRAQRVLDGDITLDAALREIELAEGKDANLRSRLAKLRADRPDLADAVAEEAMTLDAAEAQAASDAAAIKQRRWATTCNLVEAIDLLDPQPADAVLVTIADFNRTIAEQKSSRRITADRLRAAAGFLTGLAEQWED